MSTTDAGPSRPYAPPPPRPPSPPPQDRQPPPAPPSRPPVRGRPIGLALALVAAGTLWLLWQVGAPIRWELVLPIALIALGVLLLAGGRWSAHGGLIGLGVAITVIALLVSASPIPGSVSVGEHSHAVTDVAELEPSYAVGAGTLTLDLRELELPAGTTELEAGVSMGELLVLVPADVTVEGDARVGMGEVVGFDRTSSGIAPSLLLAEPGDDDRTLSLDLQVGLGRIEVRR